MELFNIQDPIYFGALVIYKCPLGSLYNGDAEDIRIFCDWDQPFSETDLGVCLRKFDLDLDLD